MRVLILYTELAGYFIACVKHLLIRNTDTKLLVVHYPVNAEAPFTFNLSESLVTIEFDKSKKSDIEARIQQFSPQLILCSGWGNRFYLKIIKSYCKDAKTVVFIDNQWHRSIKQYILRIIAPFWLTKIFKYAWVPGKPQEFYALKLGFGQKEIFTGLYVADTNLFEPVGRKKLSEHEKFPKIMISVARYIAQKDLPTLWQAFILANQNTGNQWKLNCFGFGELFDQRMENPNINHLGFKQPDEMTKYLLESGVYILPSLFEPWGVAVHEMALSAMPMILSDKIGSVSMFLDQDNGFIFEAGNARDLQERMEKLMGLSESELWKMAASSYQKGNQLQLDDWVNTLNKIAN